MKRIGLSSLFLIISVGVWAERPVTPAGPSRPFTSIVTERAQTTTSAVRPQTSATVAHPTTLQSFRPQTTVQVNYPSTTVSASYPPTTVSAVYPQTTVEVIHPQTTVEVFHPQTPGAKNAPQLGQPRIYSQQGGGEDVAGPSTEKPTSMSDFTPKPAKDFTKPEPKAPEFGGSSLALGNDTAGESAKDAMAASQVRSGQKESLETDLKDNTNALAGLEKMLTDRAKVQQKKL